ncbi:MAG TPA: toxin-antitoxin system HicB family antitoxin [Thermodesulfobacteriota bacterium]|nr:toxin-antitoxin system HicB family antitoxin [Thermodesulfobacteriota bacterium]
MTETTFKSKKLEESITTSKEELSDTRIITVRVESKLYLELKQRAEKQNVSLNEYVKTVLSEAIK